MTPTEQVLLTLALVAFFAGLCSLGAAIEKWLFRLDDRRRRRLMRRLGRSW